MQVLYTRCAGLDVHKDTIVACVRCVSPPMHEPLPHRSTHRHVSGSCSKLPLQLLVQTQRAFVSSHTRMVLMVHAPQLPSLWHWLLPKRQSSSVLGHWLPDGRQVRAWPGVQLTGVASGRLCIAERTKSQSAPMSA